MTGDGDAERSRAMGILTRLESKAVTIQTRTGEKFADDTAPKKGKPARITAKGPSKKAKKRT